MEKHLEPDSKKNTEILELNGEYLASYKWIDEFHPMSILPPCEMVI
jgi:hypothetical protein